MKNKKYINAGKMIKYKRPFIACSGGYWVRRVKQLPQVPPF